MLPAAARLRRGSDFTDALRRSRRAGRGPLVVHLAPADATRATRAGFVVGRQVGGAVERNRVRRRLRHLVAPRLAALPPGSTLVVRALPGAAQLSSAELDILLGEGLDRVRSRRRSPAGSAR